MYVHRLSQDELAMNKTQKRGNWTHASGKWFAFLEPPHKVLPLRDTTAYLPYLPYTHMRQCTNPYPHGKSSPIDAPSLRPLAQPGDYNGTVNAVCRSESYYICHPNSLPKLIKIKGTNRQPAQPKCT